MAELDGGAVFRVDTSSVAAALISNPDAPMILVADGLEGVALPLSEADRYRLVGRLEARWD